MHPEKRTHRLRLGDVSAYSLKLLFNSLDLVGNRFVLGNDDVAALRILPDVAYGANPRHRLDIIIPAGEPPHPMVIYFHGGGWIVGSKNGYRKLCSEFAARGYLTFNVEYGLAPRHRCFAQARDVACAIRWVFQHGEEYGGDRRRIFLAGDSAGAMHASWYLSALHQPMLFHDASVEQTLPPSAFRGAVLFYGVYDFKTVLGTRFPFMNTYAKSFLDTGAGAYAENAARFSPARHVTGTLPPLFLCAGERDPLYSQSVQYADALKAQGRDVTTCFLPTDRYPNAGHGFLFFYRRLCSRIALSEATHFLDRVLGSAKDTERSTGDGP